MVVARPLRGAAPHANEVMSGKRTFLTIIIPLLAGCSALPGAGPSASDVVGLAQPTGGATTPSQYKLVDIDNHVVDVLKGRQPPSFGARFGDYRASAVPRIGAGDTLSITIWEASSNGLFSPPSGANNFSPGAKSATLPDQPVGRDGSITVPYAGRLRVAGDTTVAAQRKIETALAGKAIQPQVLVNISRSLGNAVTVTGEVTTAARVPLSDKGDRLLDVLAGAGGARIPVDDAAVQLSRGTAMMSVPLTRVLTDRRENIFMRAGDTLTIIRRPLTFMAFGASGINRDVPFASDKMSLSEALAKMGGVLDGRADPSGIFVFRYEPPTISNSLVAGASASGSTTTPIAYRLNMRDPKSLFLAQNFPIFDRDVIYVSDAPVTDVQKAFSVVSSVVMPTSRAAVAGM